MSDPIDNTHIPAWAVDYLEKGDGSDLSDEQIDMADAFLSNYSNNGIGGVEITGLFVELDTSDEGQSTEERVDATPAFGEPGDSRLVNVFGDCHDD